MICFSRLALVAALSLCLSSTTNVAAAEATKKQPWTCDDMAPNLCDNLQVTEGSVATKKDLMVHYWRYSSSSDDVLDTTKTKNKEKYPVIVVNGGPGVSHDYDLILKQLACHGREVIFYDQAGTGQSAMPNGTTVQDDYPFLWDVKYYANVELPALLNELNVLQEGYHIVADSWGSMIALQFAIDHPQDANNNNLLSMVLNGPIPKGTDYADKAWDPVDGSIGRMPKYIQERMKALEAADQLDSEEMESIVGIVTTEVLYRNGIVADCVMASFVPPNEPNEEVIVGLWSQVDFMTMTGTLKDFDVYPQLDSLKGMPALLTCGEFDMVRPSVLNEMHQHMPLAERIYFLTSGHASIGDVPGEVLDNTNDFLNRVEAAIEANVDFVPKELPPIYPLPDGTTVLESCDGYHMSLVRHWVLVVVVVLLAFFTGYILGGRGRKSDYSSIV